MDNRRRHKAPHRSFVLGKKVRVVMLDGSVVTGRYQRTLRDKYLVLRMDDGSECRLDCVDVRSANYPIAGRAG